MMQGMRGQLMPLPPVKIQGASIGLDFEHATAWEFVGATKLFFRDGDNYIHSNTTDEMLLNGVDVVNIALAGTAEAKFSANILNFAQGANSVELNWSTASELDVVVDTVAQVTFTNGTFEPVTTNDIDLGTSSLEFKDAFFAGDVLASKYTSDVATGTQPYACTSTTLNTNLNADRVDSIEGAELLQRDGSVALTADWDVGAFTVRAQAFEVDSIQAGNAGTVTFSNETGQTTGSTVTIGTGAAKGETGPGVLAQWGWLTVRDGTQRKFIPIWV